MGFKIIYEPKGRALEYSDLALNIYNGCGFRCKYCYAPTVLKRGRESYSENIRERANILREVEKDCERNLFEGRRVLLCFTCDPYQVYDYATGFTRKILMIFNKYNVNFSILTKSGMLAERDFDLYKPGDSFGTTLTFLRAYDSAKWEPGASLPCSRIDAIISAHEHGIKTWVSLEPVIDTEQTLELISFTYKWTDLYKVGKLNTDNCKDSPFYKELKQIEDDTNWAKFALQAIGLLEGLNKEYYIKDDLKREIGGNEDVT